MTSQAVSSPATLPAPWQEALVYYLAHWGQAAVGVLTASALPKALEPVFRRRLELDGCILRERELTPVQATDFFQWLEAELPNLCGSHFMDLARIALLVDCATEPSIVGERALLAKRFPFPVLFWLRPEQDVAGWCAKHQVLLGERVLLLPS